MCTARKTISKKEHSHRDLSTALRFGRDDKGEGGAVERSAVCTRLFMQAIQRRLIGYSVEVFAESFSENAGTIGCTREESDRGMKFQIVWVAEDVVNCLVR